MLVVVFSYDDAENWVDFRRSCDHGAVVEHVVRAAFAVGDYTSIFLHEKQPYSNIVELQVTFP